MAVKRAVNEPITIVLFGGTGDLAQKKLLPSLFELYIRGALPKKIRIIGFSFNKLGDEKYRSFVEKVLIRNKLGSAVKRKEFLKLCYFQNGDFTDVQDYEAIGNRIIMFDKKDPKCSNKLFYLAVPPEHYNNIFNNLAKSGISIGCVHPEHWTRIAVEKPFGDDYKSAKKLDQRLGLLFKEKQVYRIDHYLAKETIENIFAFRFSNNVLAPAWDKDSIEKVEINLFEKIGIEKRGQFYDKVGALRDVGENHALQMLAAIAMDNPGSMDATQIRHKRAEILKKLRLIPTISLKHRVVRGQYSGYKKTKGVASDSKTETFFRVIAYLNSPQWKGVPFIIQGGKRLKEQKTEIKVYFKRGVACICPVDDHSSHQNILTFNIQPKENIEMRFQMKFPGLKFSLQQESLHFSYVELSQKQFFIKAYQKVLYDAIHGNQLSFTSTDEVLASWRFITPIIKKWKRLPLKIYKPGTDPKKII